jgi:hypothetical protein
LGFDAGQLMGQAARLWLFPPEIVQALQSCADPLAAPKFSPLSAVIHLAAMLSEMEVADDAILHGLPQELVVRLGIDIEWIAQYLPDPATFTDTSML